MTDPKNRDVLTRIYRLVEKYETPPKIVYSDDAEEYFSHALSDCKAVMDEFPTNSFACLLAMAVYDALDERFKAANELPLKDRVPEPEQQRFV